MAHNAYSQTLSRIKRNLEAGQEMGLLSVFTGAFGAKRTKLDQRFDFNRKWIQGSGGRFHIVKERSSGKTFGIKLIDPEKEKQFRSRFETKFSSEAQIALSFQHSNIVKTYEIGVSQQGNDFILMELIQGVLLENAVAERQARVQKNGIQIIRQLAKALQYIHEQGYIHRDFCPRNILIDSEFTTVKLFDFGLTVPNAAEYRLPKNRTGTPIYMAPEIVRRRATSVSVDLFAFGITAYQILTLEHPWGVEENSSKSALLFDSRKPTEIREHLPRLPSQIADAIMSCLEADPSKRCDSIKKFSLKMGVR